MRIVVWLVGGLVALLVLAAVAIAVVVPGLLDRPEVREAITSAAYEQLGREVRYEDLGVGLLPPSLVIHDLRIAGPPPTLVTSPRTPLRRRR